MAEASNLIHQNTEKTYPFRFGSSDKLIHLTQQQLDLIPYLSALVTHKDDFSSTQNENGEFILNNPIEYSWFMSILRSINSKNPYILLNEVSEHDNILDTLQLFDYLGIHSFLLPLLKEEESMRLNTNDTKDETTHVEYHEANLSEARKSAAEFVVALSKNEYDLCDQNTVDRIFSLVKIIFSNVSVFNSRFRHHTLTIVKECCYSVFSTEQKNLIPTIQQIAQHSKIDSFMYLYDDEKPVPDDFRNSFAWKGVYVPIQDMQIKPSIVNSEERYHLRLFSSEWISYRHPKRILVRLLLFGRLLSSYDFDIDNRELPIYETKQSRKNKEAQSARSGHFDTLSRRPKVDKFKHRSGPKAQKHR